jgi:peptidase E
MRGRVLFNGNAGSDLIDVSAPYILSSAHGRPPKVLIVTAAWGAGEYNEGPIKRALYEIGVPADLRDGYDRNVFNLCAWHAWADFLGKRPDVALIHADIEAAQDEIRRFYLDKTAFHADLVRRGVRAVRARRPRFQLGRVNQQDPLRPEAVHTGSEIVEKALGRELAASIDALVENDERMLGSFRDAEEALLTRTGLRMDPHWRAVRALLESRILEADAVMLFGGSPQKLLAPFRFFDLRPALLETLRRGATVVASSAGALVLCERMIVYDERNGDPSRRDFRLLDAGLGLVGGLQILPHCMDRIHTDDADNLAYLARRFGSRVCAGLNEGSYLLVDLGGPTATSVGRADGVYVFGKDGVKHRYHFGERIPM